jgi:transcriptional regulator with XRE-family HTH domain
VAEKTDDLLPEERKFAEEVQRRRKALGWNQTEMAERLVEEGVVYMTQSTVSRIEKLQRPVRVGEAEAWSTVFEVSVFRLMHPLPIDELIESARWNYNVLRRAWRDIDEALRRYARVRGDLPGTIDDLRVDATHPEADSTRSWELNSLVLALEDQQVRERGIGNRLTEYMTMEAADGEHPTAP